MTQNLGTGIAFPFATDRRGAIALARDEDDVGQAIFVILSTAPGERPMRPEFGCGVHALVFEAVDALTLGQMEHAIRVALTRWEPRIEVQGIDFGFSQVDGGRLDVEIVYRLRTTNSIRNLVHPFYIIPAEDAA
jgi:phage baseplate assembly protein W